MWPYIRRAEIVSERFFPHKSLRWCCKQRWNAIRERFFPFQDNEISFNQAKGLLDCSCIFRNVCKLSGSLTQNMNEYGLLKCKVCASKYTLCNHSKPIWVPLQLLSTGAASFFCSHAWSRFVCTAVGRGC